MIFMVASDDPCGVMVVVVMGHQDDVGVGTGLFDAYGLTVMGVGNYRDVAVREFKT